MGQNRTAWYFAQKVAYFEEIDTFWWFFTKCHTFCNILLKIGSKPYCMVLCTKSGLFRGDRHVLVVFHQMPYFLQHFAKNWVKTLLHGTLRKKWLISRRSTRFGGFSPNAIRFCNILLKIGSKPYCTVLCTKSGLFRGDRHVLVVFHQMPYFLQHFAKNWVKTLLHGTLHKKLLISRRSTRFGGFSPNAILFATFC